MLTARSCWVLLELNKTPKWPFDSLPVLASIKFLSLVNSKVTVLLESSVIVNVWPFATEAPLLGSESWVNCSYSVSSVFSVLPTELPAAAPSR